MPATYKNRNGVTITADEALNEQLAGRPVQDVTTLAPVTIDVTPALQGKAVVSTPSFTAPGSTKASTANVTVGGDAIHNVDATGGVITVTLPSPVASVGRVLIITRINAGGNAVTVVTPQGSLINRALGLRDNTRVLGTQNASVTLYSDGHNWLIVSVTGTVT